MPRLKVYEKKYAMSDLGLCIVDRRRRMKMTQSDLAKKLGITQQQVSYMENNPERITQEDLYELNKVLDFDILQLLRALGKTTQEILAFVKEYR